MTWSLHEIYIIDIIREMAAFCENTGHQEKLKRHKHKKHKKKNQKDLDAFIHENESYNVSAKMKKAKKHKHQDDMDSPVATSETDDIEGNWREKKKEKKKRMIKKHKEHNLALESDTEETIPENHPLTELGLSQRFKKKKKKRKYSDGGQGGKVFSPSGNDFKQSSTYICQGNSEENNDIRNAPNKKKKKHKREHSELSNPHHNSNEIDKPELNFVAANRKTTVKKKHGHEHSHSEEQVMGQLVEIGEQIFLDEVNIPGSMVTQCPVEPEIPEREGNGDGPPSMPLFLQAAFEREKVVNFPSADGEDEGEDLSSQPGQSKFVDSILVLKYIDSLLESKAEDEYCDCSVSISLQREV